VADDGDVAAEDPPREHELGRGRSMRKWRSGTEESERCEWAAAAAAKARGNVAWHAAMSPMRSARVATSWEGLWAFGSGSWEGWTDAGLQRGGGMRSALVVNIWVREKVLFDMVRSRGLPECCEKIYFVGTCGGE